MPAGAALWGSAMYNTPPSGLPRAEVKAQVLQARADGTLLPAGEAAEAPRSFDQRNDVAGRALASSAH